MAASRDTRELFDAAMRDFRAMVGMYDSRVFVDEIYGFHAQQAVEKALKAWLSHLGETYERKHDLLLALAQLRRRGIDVRPYTRWMTALNPYAVVSRYGPIESAPTPLDRNALQKNISELLQHVEEIIEA